MTASVPSAWVVLPGRSFAMSVGNLVRFVVAYTPVAASVALVARFLKAPVDTMALLVAEFASAERTSFVALELQR